VVVQEQVAEWVLVVLVLVWELLVSSPYNQNLNLNPTFGNFGARPLLHAGLQIGEIALIGVTARTVLTE
jgi:hypothetical protein